MRPCFPRLRQRRLSPLGRPARTQESEDERRRQGAPTTRAPRPPQPRTPPTTRDRRGGGGAEQPRATRRSDRIERISRSLDDRQANSSPPASTPRPSVRPRRDQDQRAARAPAAPASTPTSLLTAPEMKPYIGSYATSRQRARPARDAPGKAPAPAGTRTPPSARRSTPRSGASASAARMGSWRRSMRAGASAP